MSGTPDFTRWESLYDVFVPDGLEGSGAEGWLDVAERLYSFSQARVLEQAGDDTSDFPSEPERASMRQEATVLWGMWAGDDPALNALGAMWPLLAFDAMHHSVSPRELLLDCLRLCPTDDEWESLISSIPQATAP